MNRDLLIGGISGIVSRTITAPLELWKIQQQNYFIPNSTFRDVLQKEGMRYLWKGNYANCIRIFPQYSCFPATLHNYKFQISAPCSEPPHLKW